MERRVHGEATRSKPITLIVPSSQTTWLKVKPHYNHGNHKPLRLRMLDLFTLKHLCIISKYIRLNRWYEGHLRLQGETPRQWTLPASIKEKEPHWFKVRCHTRFIPKRGAQGPYIVQ
eukprot:1157514-Pelagomonas_calceolata.AAC.4